VVDNIEVNYLSGNRSMAPQPFVDDMDDAERYSCESGACGPRS
jgi:hypothetical protein